MTPTDMTSTRTNTVTAPAFPPGRYGRRRAQRRTPRWVLPSLVTAVVALGLLLSFVMYDTFADDKITSRVTSYRITSDTEVSLTFEVTTNDGEAALCIVRARSRDGREVGRAEVPVPAAREGQATVAVTYSLATSKRAVAPEVYGCGPA